MLYYGNAQNIQDNCVVLNFTSFIEGYPRLDLVPPNSLGATSEFDFDYNYMMYIMNDHYRFSQMFQIISLLMSGANVYIVVSDDNWSENLIESLLKLIQQRYGFNATRVNSIDDVFYANQTDIDKTYGVGNYDQDLERYSYILESARLNSGGQVGGY